MGLLTNILYAFLKPKVESDIAKMKSDPKYIELERQEIEAKKELEEINKKLENARAESAKNIKAIQDAGLQVTDTMSPKEMFRQYKKWQAEECDKLGMEQVNPDWEKNWGKE